MIIRHNIPGINASRNGGIVEGRLSKSLEKLSTGYRINRAGDDAAGLAISEGMRSQINGLNQAIRNVNDGISMSQTGDGALAEVHDMLGRLKTLAIEAANGTYTSQTRMNLEAERLQLLDEIDRIGGATEFDGIPLFDDGVPGAPIEPPQESETMEAITLQIGHSAPETLDVGRYYMNSKALRLDTTDFSSVESANGSVDVIENAIQAISEIRANFGAAQMHLEHTDRNLGVTSENMTAAESQIRDANMSQEYTNFTKESILQNASSYMTAQAHALPQMVLSLLQG